VLRVRAFVAITAFFLLSGFLTGASAKTGVLLCNFSSPVQASFDNSPPLRTALSSVYLLGPGSVGTGGEPQSISTPLDIRNLMSVTWEAQGEHIRIQGQNAWFTDSVSVDTKSAKAVLSRLSLGAIGVLMKGECRYVN